MRDVELNDDQIERNDEIYNEAFELIKVLTGNKDMEWDMYYIGEIADAAAYILCKMGFKIRFPSIVDNRDGTQEICEFYEA